MIFKLPNISHEYNIRILKKNSVSGYIIPSDYKCWILIIDGERIFYHMVEKNMSNALELKPELEQIKWMVKQRNCHEPNFMRNHYKAVFIMKELNLIN